MRAESSRSQTGCMLCKLRDGCICKPGAGKSGVCKRNKICCAAHKSGLISTDKDEKQTTKSGYDAGTIRRRLHVVPSSIRSYVPLASSVS